MPAGGNSRFRNYPARMSERQQLALLLQITSQDIVLPGPETNASPKTKRSKAKHNTDRKEDYLKLIDDNYERSQAANPETLKSIGSEKLGASEEEPATGVKGSEFPQFQQELVSSVRETRPSAGEESGAPCEMRRTPPQNKVDRSATGQSGSSPRVTLRINNVRAGARDEKKGSRARAL